MSNLCVVLGNGPSLRGFDLFRLDGVATLGMNAAYRYWDEIDWRPSYYACLDDQLIISHHDQIFRLWREGRIRRFFVHGTYFDRHPECIGAPEFFSLDQVLPHWYRKRGKAQGWPDLTGDPAFRTQDTTKVTTGAFATRFAAHMGHDTLALMGIDLKYVEMLPEAEPTEGVGLRIRETPKSNPNYFFDSYQQAGDKYNIPNPDVHGNALHIQSFRLVNEDFQRNGLNVRIFNTNPASLIEQEKVFPLHSIDRLLIPHDLAAVTVPATGFEIGAILANFDIWSDPRYAPLAVTDTDNRCALVFMFNNREAERHESAIREKFAATGMERFFSRLNFEYLGIEGEADHYQRDYRGKVGEQGYKAGPNNMFFRAMARARSLGRYIFQMETDCVPLRRGWLTRLRRITAEAQPPFWIMGSTYRGVGTLSPSFRNHLNGNAVYAVGEPAFQKFLDEFWEPRTRRMVAVVDRRLAYDCILEKLFTEQRDADPEVRRILDEHGDKFRPTEFIINLSGKRDLEQLSPGYREETLEKFPDAYILHNRTAQQRTAEESNDPPRLLIIDMTAMGNGSATGEIKANLLRAWPAERLLQLASPGKDRLSLVRPDGGGGFETTETSGPDIQAAIAAFRPEAILYRPLADLPHLHELAMQLIEKLNLPLITWIMDDWPARLQADDPARFARLDRDLRQLLDRSVLRLSICDAMSEAFEKRYGHSFTAFANGIDPDQWSGGRDHREGPVVIRYAGGLAPDMNAESVQRVARAVEMLAARGRDIRLEINTQSWWLERSAPLFEGLKATSLSAERRSFADYAAWLRGADILLIAYNFDEMSQRYVRYSMANKLPECLASGAAVLVHGPRGIATSDYAAGTGAACLAERADPHALEAVLERLCDPEQRRALAAKGRALALERHSLPLLAQRFARLLRETCSSAPDTAARAAARTGQDAARFVDNEAARKADRACYEENRRLQVQIDQQYASLMACRVDCKRLRYEAARADEAIAAARAEQEALRAQLDEIYRSRSWRVTQPLRGLRRTASSRASPSAATSEAGRRECAPP